MSEKAEVRDEREENGKPHHQELAIPKLVEPSVVEHAVKRTPVLRFIFFGANGLRPGWGLLLFLVIFAALSGAVAAIVEEVHPMPAKTSQQTKAPAKEEQQPSVMLIVEGSSFALITLTSWIMSKVERRPMVRYGLGGSRRLRPFFAGLAWGLLFLAVLVGALWKMGLLVFDGRLLFGVAAWKYAAIWTVGFVLVALLEEYMLRGYLQYTVARGAASLYGLLFETKHRETLGFWTAAAALSFVFGFGHGGNPGESAVGLWAAGLIGLIFCLTLWKTGSLWWAVGFHASWDWAQSFVFGVADSGTMVQGHLYASHPVGRVLWSGGATGPEGSALILPVLALLVVVIQVTLPKRRWSIEGAGS